MIRLLLTLAFSQVDRFQAACTGDFISGGSFQLSVISDRYLLQ
ncbi:MAG: hypothetical protein WBA93_25105 [Microcoleaceae cyanobacterium]